MDRSLFLIKFGLVILNDFKHRYVVTEADCLNCTACIQGSCKKFCHWVRITSVLRFIKHIFITNLQSIPLLLKHIFVTFLPSSEKQINKHFLKHWK